MPNSEPTALRERARLFRQRASVGDYPPFIVKAFNEIAKSLERRALTAEATSAIVDRPKRRR
jgi:hypothetical protein